MTDIPVRRAYPADRPAIDAMFVATWGESRVAAGGRLYDLRALPALVATRPDGVARSRELKPSIPLIGSYGIPVRDEIVLGRELPDRDL